MKTVPASKPDKDRASEKKKPEGPRTPYPVDHPGVSQQPGSEPDYLPGKPSDGLPSL